MRKFLYKAMLWSVAVSLLNRSIDVEDNAPVTTIASNAGQSEEFNEIESIAELVLEETTDKTLPDSKESDQKGFVKKLATTHYSITDKREKSVRTTEIADQLSLRIRDIQQNLPPGHTTIFSPPPDFQS